MKCVQGTYADVEGQTSCASCNAGTYTNETGAIECITCDIGSSCPSTTSGAVLCLPGTYSDVEGKQCSNIVERIYS